MDNAQLALSLGLIGLGLVLLVAELFVPSGGILTALAVAALVVGVVIPFIYGDTRTGLLTLGGVIIVVPTLISFLLFYVWPKTPLGRRLMQSGPQEDATLLSMPGNVELEQLRGRFGRAVSSLRPSGVAEFDGRRVDCISEGMMVEPGTWVRCIEVRAGRVLVRPVEDPDLGKLENADFT